MRRKIVAKCFAKYFAKCFAKCVAKCITVRSYNEKFISAAKTPKSRKKVASGLLVRPEQ